MAKAKAYKNLIAGEWVESTSGNTFANHNPADQRELIVIRKGVTVRWLPAVWQMKPD